MKKLTAIIVTALFALALAACGAKPPAPSGSQQPGTQADAAAIKSNFDKAYDYVQALIQSDNVQADKFEDDPENLTCMWTFPDAPSDVDLSEDVEIDGQKITIGKTLVKDLAGLGFEITKSSDDVQPNEIFGIQLTKAGKSVMLETHGTEKAQPSDALPVYGFTGGMQDFAIPYNYNGLTAASTLKDVLDIMGVPNADIRLSTDSMTSTIEVSYMNEQTVGDQTEQNRLSVTCTYDAASNTAVITSLNLSRDYYTADMME